LEFETLNAYSNLRVAASTATRALADSAIFQAVYAYEADLVERRPSR